MSTRYLFIRFLALLAGVVLVSCDRCNKKKFPVFTFPAEMEYYFGVYKPGNWWVYQNVSGTVRDSVFISEFEEKIMHYCVEKKAVWQRSIKLRSQHLFTESVDNSEYSARGPVFYMYANRFTLEVQYRDGKFFTPTVNPAPMHKVDTTIDGVPHNNALRRELVLISPGIGLVTFNTLNDTFLLLKHDVSFK